VCKMRSDRLNNNSNLYNQEYSPDVLLEYNYITCNPPVTSAMSAGVDDVTADGAQVPTLFFGPENQPYGTNMVRVGAFTVAGYPPQIGGTVPATDTASTAAGLNLQLDHDETDDAGMELYLGSTMGSAFSSFTAGTDGGYIDATFFSAAWDDYDAVSVGFRKAEVYASGHGAALGGAANGDGVYTDYAAFGLMGTADKVSSDTDSNNSGTSAWTDSTQTATDSQNCRIRINLDSNGAVSYQHVQNAVAGAGTLAAPTATAAFSFDSGDTLIPYVLWHGAGHEDVAIYLKDIKIVKYANGGTGWSPNR
jgi:hypothetical protein